MKKYLFSIFSVGVAGLGFASLPSEVPEGAAVNVTQHHNNHSRDGLHIDPAFTTAAAANLTRDLGFNGTIAGNVYAQPLYIEGGPSGPVVIAVTESNNVYALNATTGAIVWQRNLGAAVTSGLPCGNINPLGITATPIVDLASRSLFLNAEVSGSGHQIYSLNVDTGATNAGWPVTVSTAVSGFDTDRSQSSRAALGILGNILYVPYGGRFGDCGSYRGRVIGVQMNNPASIGNWATISTRAGIWGPGGIANDGTNLFVTTGNGSGGVTWSGSEAVIRLQPGPSFTGSTTDFWAPTNWAALDSADLDLGGSGPIIVDVPGATPSALVVALGKDGRAYVLSRSNLGGVALPLASAQVGTGSNIQAAATYRTATGTFVVFRPTTGTLTAFRITATNPPTIATGWTISSSGRTSPFVTSTDGTNNMIAWAAGSDGRLRGYNGETGAVIFNGGGANELMTGIRSFNTGIAARGRIYYAADNRVYAFGVTGGATPTPSPTPTATATATATVAPPTPTPTPSPCVRFVITINGAQEVPPSGSAGTGTGTIEINTITNQLSYNITFSGLGSAETMAHIHGFAPPGTNAGIIHNLPLGSPKVGVFNYSDAQEADILNGLSYVNIHSVNFSGGEIRGQIAGPMLPCTTPTPNPGTPTPSATPTATATATATATVAPPTPTPGVTPSPTPAVTPSPTPAQALNLSTRMNILTGANVGIGGFIITGTGPKHLLLRAIGPSLTQLGVANALADPVMQLFGPKGFTTITNDNWRDDPVQEAAIIATGIPPSNDREAAIDVTLLPGAYTAIVSGKDNTTGVGLVEVYDLSQVVPAKLANISTRAFVGVGSDIVIAGFILGGNTGMDRLIVRGIGPSLTPLGVAQALADPTLELRDSNGAVVISNNDWQDNAAQAAELTAAGLAPTNPLESGLAASLSPGLYTALLAGLNNGTGVGLVEVYDQGAP